MSRGSQRLFATLVAGMSVLAVARADAQVVANQRDDFEGGTTMGWHVGDPTHPAPPTVIATDGPAGAGDAYLRLTSFGSGGPGSRLSALNTTRWAGNYIAAGVTQIEMDLINLGQNDVSLRLLFGAFPDGQGPPTDLAWSADAFFLRAGAGWVHAVFPILPGAMIVPLGTYAGALGGADELRLFHNPAPVFAGPENSSPPIAAVVGVDNIRAVAVVPEPATVALLATGVLGLAAARRRTRRA
ncbi:PEP-CTERM sorting domain-containing protein [Roseisolibacter agri]|uniref:Ice-binding protein C-terminal domain-containing protein n=1 Tax=Roseisolibacter agri TaxID=2014610 RepID=A0AA37Q3F6_9BACT|nr:PEP-CTERM sorting domain-containing protein [Roseisolibacter agri]GLC25674.1 hypothetical protein rosag_21870 [Roseisolibacter agri]